MDSQGLTPALIAAYQEQLKHPGENNAVLIKGLNSLFIIIASTTLLLRLYARYVTRTRYGWDDALAILAYLFTMALISLFVLNADQSDHIVFLTPKQIQREMRTIYASQYLYAGACGTYKAAICHYYLRIFTTRKAILQIRCTIVLTWALVLSCAMVLPFECKPINHAWQLLTPGKCIDIPAFLIASAVLATLLDVLIITLPIPLIWSLHLSRSKKISVSAVFLLGGVVVISSIMRAYYIKNLVIGANSYDPSFNNTTPSLWTICELTLGLACACLPTVWPLLIKTRAKAKTMHSHWKQSHSNDKSMATLELNQQLASPTKDSAGDRVSKPMRVKEKYLVSTTDTDFSTIDQSYNDDRSLV